MSLSQLNPPLLYLNTGRTSYLTPLQLTLRRLRAALLDQTYLVYLLSMIKQWTLDLLHLYGYLLYFLQFLAYNMHIVNLLLMDFLP